MFTVGRNLLSWEIFNLYIYRCLYQRVFSQLSGFKSCSFFLFEMDGGKTKWMVSSFLKLSMVEF